MARQMALANSFSTTTASGISKGPSMFLQKLYKIVDDPGTNDLISWTESEDAFYVHDSERLAREQLPHWFKHNKFTSFVRQLNMYGFHKVQDLQAGALRSDTAIERLEFKHEKFRKGKVDWLADIKRKGKDQPDPMSSDVGFAVLSPSGSIPAALPAPPVAAQVPTFDMHSIVNGIAAIRRHQTTISSELNELRRNNQALWQESMEARARHQKQQDTINRIVKFLAGVFGHQASSPSKDGELTPPASASGPGTRPAPRLMIEDRRREPKVAVEEVDDVDSPVFSRDQTPLSTNRFVSMDTPRSAIDAPSPAMTEISNFPPPTPRPDPALMQVEPAPTVAPQAPISHPQFPMESAQVAAPLSRSITPTGGRVSPDLEGKLASAVNGLSPAELAQLLTTILSQPPIAAPDMYAQQPALPQYPSYPPWDFSTMPAPPPHPQNAITDAGSTDLISFDDASAMPFKLNKSWEATEDIEKDVETVDGNIDNLIQTMGFDPDFLQHPDDMAASMDGIGSSSEHFFNTFLNTFPPVVDGRPGSTDTSFNADDAAATAFLDEVPSPAPSNQSGNSPLTVLKDLPVTRGQKRKSDVATDGVRSAAAAPTSTTVTGRPKRRKADK